MGYKGYIIKINGTAVPGAYISSYKSVPNRQQDKDSYTDNDGLTHRNILPHTKSTVEITTGILNLDEKKFIKNLFPAREYIELEYWNDDKGEYATGTFYMPDVEYEILDFNTETIHYRPITFKFIEY